MTSFSLLKSKTTMSKSSARCTTSGNCSGLYSTSSSPSPIAIAFRFNWVPRSPLVTIFWIVGLSSSGTTRTNQAHARLCRACTELASRIPRDSAQMYRLQSSLSSEISVESTAVYRFLLLGPTSENAEIKPRLANLRSNFS